MALYYAQRDRDEPSLDPADFTFPGVEPAGLGALNIAPAGSATGWTASLPVRMSDGQTRIVEVDDEGRLR